MALRDHRLSRLLATHLDGIPLDLAVTLLPISARFCPSLLLHLYGHARSQRRWQSRPAPAAVGRASFGELAFRGLVDSLRRAVSELAWRPRATTWANYYEDAASYSVAAAAHKRAVVGRFLDELRPGVVWDLGANTGVFSRLDAERGWHVIAFERDSACVEAMYHLVATGSGATASTPS